LRVELKLAFDLFRLDIYAWQYFLRFGLNIEFKGLIFGGLRNAVHIGFKGSTGERV
jgi:hypothetical protein